MDLALRRSIRRWLARRPRRGPGDAGRPAGVVQVPDRAGHVPAPALALPPGMSTPTHALRLPSLPPDPLADAMDAHARAEDVLREAQRLATGLRARRDRALVAAAERRRLSGEALRRGDEAWGLSLLDAALDAERAAGADAVRLEGARRRVNDLSAAERACRQSLFRALSRRLAEGATSRGAA